MEWLTLVVIYVVLTILICLIVNISFKIRSFSSFIMGTIISTILVSIIYFFSERKAYSTGSAGLETIYIISGIAILFYVMTRVIRDKY